MLATVHHTARAGIICSAMIKHLGIICIALVWISTYVLLRRHSLDPNKSISEHATKNRMFQVVFGVAEIVITVLFSVFLFGWLIPYLQLGTAYGVIAATGLICTLVAAIIPEKPGWQKIIHGVAAYTMATTLALSNVLLLYSPQVNPVAKIVLALALLGMIAIAILGWRGKKGLFGQSILAMQIGYYALYHVSILAATYLS